MKIEVTIQKSVPAADWHRRANKAARRMAQVLGVDWIDADVIVYLPERGRFMTKSPGRDQLVAHG